MSAKAIRSLIRQLARNDEASILDALDALARFGPLATEALPKLIPLVQDYRVPLRHRAINTLGRIGPAAAEAIPALLNQLTDASRTVRQGVLRAIGRIGPITLPQLIDNLWHGENAGRIQAARALAAYGNEAVIAVPHLLKTLEAEHPRLRVAAAMALAAIGAPIEDAIPQLKKILRKEPPSTLPALAEALASYPEVGRSAVPLLLKMLTGEPEKARPRALHALGKLGPLALPALPALLELQKQTDSPLRSAALVAIGKMGPAAAEAVPVLLELLPSEGEKRTERIVEVLGAFGSPSAPAVPWLIGKLNEAYGSLRLAIFRTLGKIGSAAAEAIPALLRAAGDSAAHVRAGAIQALGALGPVRPEVEPALVHAVGDPDATVRLEALRALAPLPLASATLQPLLVQALQDHHGTIRRQAACILGRKQLAAAEILQQYRDALSSPYGEVRREAAEFVWEVAGKSELAIPVLREAVREDDRAVRLQAITLLQQIARADGKAAAALMYALGNADEPLGRPAASALVPLGERIVPALREALASSDRAIREGALYVAGRLGRLAEKTIPAILPLLIDEEAEVRATAIRSLGQIGCAVATVAPPLVELLADDSPTVRAWAALSLGSMGDPACLPALFPALRHKDARTRIAALTVVEYLGSAGLGALPAVGELLRDPDKQVNLRAQYALSALGRERAPLLAPLVELLAEENDAYREWATLMLVPHGVTAIPLLLPLLTKAEVMPRRGAAETLGQMGAAAEAAVPLLIACLDDPPVNNKAQTAREQVIWALSQIGAASVPGLLRSLESSDSHWRTLGVLETLGRIGATALGAVPSLVTLLLREKSALFQRMIAEALGQMGAEAIQALASELQQARPSAEVIRLVTALGVIGSPARLALPALNEPLCRGEAAVQKAVLWALGRILSSAPETRDWVALVVERVPHLNPQVGEQAAITLGQMGMAAHAAIADLLSMVKRSTGAPRRAILLALGEIVGAGGSQPPNAEEADAIWKTLVPLMNDADEGVRQAVVRALARLDTVAQTERGSLFTQALNDRAPVVQREALQALLEVGDEATLRKILADERPLVRREVFRQMVGLQPADQLKLLRRGLADRDWEIQRLSAVTLGTLGEAAHAEMPALSRALASPVKVVREAALASLQLLDTEGTQIVTGLQQALLSSSLRVRAWAIDELGKLKERAAPASAMLVLLVSQWRGGISARAAAALQAIGQPAVPALIGALTDANPRIREQTLNSFHSLDQATYYLLQPFRDQLGNPPPDVQKKLTKSLAAFGAEAPTTLKSLVAQLKDRHDWTKRRSAAWALGKMGTKAASAVKPLSKALGDSDWDVRVAVVDALGQIGPEAVEAVPALLERLGDYDQVKTRVIVALGRIGQIPQDARDTLVKLINPDKNETATVRVAVEMLARQGVGMPRALRHLRKLLRSDDPEMRLWAVWALAQFGEAGKSHAAELLPLFEKGHPRVQAWAALAYLRLTGEVPAILPALTRLLPCREPDVQDALLGLVRLGGAEAEGAVRAALGHADPRWRRAAGEVLRRASEPTDEGSVWMPRATPLKEGTESAHEEEKFNDDFEEDFDEE